MPTGTFRHESIAAASPKKFECKVGLFAHYAIGVLLTVAFVELVSTDWLVRPRLLPALIYGIVTVAFPFFVMEPAIGLGVASSRTATPAHSRLKSVATHTVFGIALYLCAIVLSSDFAG